MGFPIENNEHIQERVFFSTANLLNLEVDLIYLDTTSTYFEVEPGFGEEEELRRAGHSKDHRPELLQRGAGAKGEEGSVSPRHMNPMLKSYAYANPEPPADEAKPIV